MEYKKLEELNQSKKNQNEIHHLQLHECHLPTVAWEASLRENPRKKKAKKSDIDSATKVK